jgi:hypothetical protein
VNDKIMKYVPGQAHRVSRNSNGANGNCFDAQGRPIPQGRTRRVVRMDKKGGDAGAGRELAALKRAQRYCCAQRRPHLFHRSGVQHQADTPNWIFRRVSISPKGDLS